MKNTKIALLSASICLALNSGASFAITNGTEDLNNLYPNVVSVRGIIQATNLAAGSCTGSLLHVDNNKLVILTAAHCTDGWKARLSAGTINSVGV